MSDHRSDNQLMSPQFPPAAQGLYDPRFEHDACGVRNASLPRDAAQREPVRKIVNDIIAAEGQRLLGWRVVPTSPRTLGDSAASVMPAVEQVFVGFGGDAAMLTIDPLQFERKLYV